MGTNPSQHRVTAIGLAVLAALILANSAAYAVPGVLERPAIESERAAKSVLLAVTSVGSRLVAVGERGHVMLSDDHGATWRQAKVPVSATLTAVRFATPQKGWAVGHFGIVLHTEDGGESWVKQLDGKQAAQIVLDHFKARVRRGEGNAEALKRQLTAARQLVDDGPDKPFLDLYFENEMTGFIVGAYNLIFATRDGGKTWAPWQDRIDNPKGLHLYAIRASRGDLYIAGEQGGFWRSRDAGRSFSALATPYGGSYFGLLTAQSGELVLFGLRGNAFWSGDRGTSWQRIETGTPAAVTAGTRLSDGTLLLVTQGGQLLASRNKGRSFQPLLLNHAWPFAGVAQAVDGSVALVGVRGVTRMQIPARHEATVARVPN